MGIFQANLNGTIAQMIYPLNTIRWKSLTQFPTGVSCKNFEFHKFEINDAKRRIPDHAVNKGLKIAICISPSRKLQGKENSSATYLFSFFQVGGRN